MIHISGNTKKPCFFELSRAGKELNQKTICPRVLSYLFLKIIALNIHTSKVS
jgi:hypothetical protein